MKAHGSRVRALVPTAVLLAALVVQGPAPAAFPGQNGVLIASGAVGATEGLFTFRPDGSNLGHTAGSEGMKFPALSPNGRKVAFSATEADNEDVYVVEPNGSITRITNDLADDRDPAWSPNGRQLVFVSNREGNDELYIFNIDDSTVRRLTNNTVADTQPTWSSTNVIAFTRQETAGQPSTEIILINPDGTGEDQLTVSPKSASEANFSPDGTKLLFTRAAEDAAANDEIFRVDLPDGLNLQNLTNTETTDEHDAVYSPDGQRVVFLRSYLATEVDVVSINSDTGDLRVMVDNSTLESLDWQPLCGTCNTVTTINVKYRGTKLAVKGRVSPARPAGQSVIVSLHKKVGGKLRKVSQKSVVLESIGNYSTSIKRVDGGKCKVKTTYPGDDDVFGSSASTPLFPC